MKANSRADFASLLLRVGLGLILTYYGAQKIFGVFGGPGYRAVIDMFQSKMGIPPALTVLAMCGEFLGGLGMILGLLTPVAAFGAACTMAVATYENWQTPGMLDHVYKGLPEDSTKAFYSFALCMGTLAVMILGGGRFSLDAKLFLKGRKRT